MVNLKDLTFEELKNFLVEQGEKPFRASQIFAWLHRGVSSFDEMTDLSVDLRKRLAEVSCVSTLKIAAKLESKIDETKKYLFELEDGNKVESVVMYYKHGITICISCQVGCRMGCKFCASTIGGLVRSLTPGEMLDQILFAQKDIGDRISNIVMMGIGEPLDNFDNVIKFLENVNNPKGLNIGYRHISLSTCGLVPNIERLRQADIPITLSVSLHAPTDEIRNEIMPVNKAYNISELLGMCRRYSEYTKRRISFEYAIIDGVNDSPRCAQKLAAQLKSMLCHVNIIPVNNVEENNFRKPSPTKIRRFISVLEQNGITATVRRELGSDISASCGQLRRNSVIKEEFR